MNKGDKGKAWLEPLLTQNLDRVAAPQELWDRVQAPAPPAASKRVVRPALVWAGAAAVLIIAAAVTWEVRQHTDTTLTNEALAAQALRRGFGQLEFRSEEAGEIRAWIKGRTGLEIPLLDEPAPSIHLVGASVAIPGPAPTAEVVYRVGDREAVLLVAKAEPKLYGSATHKFLSSGQYRGSRVSSWVMRGQLCTLACPIPQNPQAACLLCHATEAPKIVDN